MDPTLSNAMATARAEQGMLGALAVPRITVGNNPFIKSQAGAIITFCRCSDMFLQPSGKQCFFF